MTSKTSQSNSYYLAITAIISAGVLSGCEYCIPVLAALLLLPLIRHVSRKLIDISKTALAISYQATSN